MYYYHGGGHPRLNYTVCLDDDIGELHRKQGLTDVRALYFPQKKIKIVFFG